MKNLLVLFTISILLFSCDRISKFLDAEANKTKDPTSESTKNFTGLREQHHRNGNLRSAINYKDGKKHGVARNYYDNGKVKLELNYENGMRSGKSLYYYENGDLYRESYYKNDKLDGIRKVYKNKKLKSEVSYLEGEPGKGLKEYLLNRNLKTKYPRINVRTIDRRLADGTYILDIHFTDSHPKDAFYFGKLKQGKYIHSGLENIPSSKGHGKYTIVIPPGAFIMKTLNIVGVHNTKQGNPYVTTRTYNLSIE